VKIGRDLLLRISLDDANSHAELLKFPARGRSKEVHRKVETRRCRLRENGPEEIIYIVRLVSAKRHRRVMKIVLGPQKRAGKTEASGTGIIDSDGAAATVQSECPTSEALRAAENDGGAKQKRARLVEDLALRLDACRLRFSSGARQVFPPFRRQGVCDVGQVMLFRSS